MTGIGRVANRVGAVAALALGVALAGCDRPGGAAGEGAPAPTATAAFAHAFDGDLSGYYMPSGETAAGAWRLDHLFIGQATDFADWEAGRRSGTFAPVMLEFVDPSSPTTATELGEVHTGRIRVLPERYSVTEDRVRFTGRSPDLGEVTFEGRLDVEALASARRNLGDEAAVLTGTLTAGGATVRGVRLRWWAGD